MERATYAEIDLGALRHNLQRAIMAAPTSKVLSVIKANAYGHGLVEAANAMETLTNGFAVSHVSEAVELRNAGISVPVVVLLGYKTEDELRLAARHHLSMVIHDTAQLKILDDITLPCPINVVIKLDTGMHRLGLPCQDVHYYFQRLCQHANVDPPPLIMTHLACADDKQSSYTDRQVECFKRQTQGIDAETSMANSAGTLGWPETHADWIRPGIMLYGTSPFAGRTAKDDNLIPVMTLRSSLIAVHRLSRGDLIGYGSTEACPEDMTVGVVAAGYADGYPRRLPSGSPVWVNGHTSKTMGRVSMDTIVINLKDIPAKVGDEVELWGKNLMVDDIADKSGTISYELLCNAGNNCTRIYKDR